MPDTYLFCPVEQEYLSEIPNPDAPCEYCGGGCSECPHVIEVDEDGHEIPG